MWRKYLTWLLHLYMYICIYLIVRRNTWSGPIVVQVGSPSPRSPPSVTTNKYKFDYIFRRVKWSGPIAAGNPSPRSPPGVPETLLGPLARAMRCEGQFWRLDTTTQWGARLRHWKETFPWCDRKENDPLAQNSDDYIYVTNFF